MSVGLGSAIFDATRSTIFSTRNVDKTAHGDFVRAAVAVGQAKNAISAIANLDNMAGAITGAGIKKLGAVAESSKAVGYIAKGINWASNMVNPLISLSGIVKVGLADDKESEAIKQTLSLGTMFSVEKIAKLFMTPEGRAKLSKFNFANKGFIKKIMNVMQNIDNYSAAVSKSKWGKIGIPLLKGCTYVCLSVAAYTLGSKISDKINEARLKKADDKPLEACA